MLWTCVRGITTSRMSGLQAACRVETESESPAHTLSSVCACVCMCIHICMNSLFIMCVNTSECTLTQHFHYRNMCIHIPVCTIKISVLFA